MGQQNVQAEEVYSEVVFHVTNLVVQLLVSVLVLWEPQLNRSKTQYVLGLSV